MTSSNMYKVGDYVFFEASAPNPYHVRRIEELNKTVTGAVEAKVVCLYRRRDIPENLVPLADKYMSDMLELANQKLSDEDCQKLRHRELFLSRIVETLPATHIRGKCLVKLHYEDDLLSKYLDKDDMFFFQLVYDPLLKTLQTDRASIRLGVNYQATLPEVQPCYKANSNQDQLWNPDCGLSEEDLNTYILLVRSLATMGRAHHMPSLVRQPSLSMAAASACRDSTLQLALDTLQKHNYQIFDAIKALCPEGTPILRFDEMETWSAYDGNLFEEALEKFGKNFYDIQSDILNWYSVRNIVEFYYMWKTTNNYIEQKKIKAVEAEHKLIQVYIPNFSKPINHVLYQNAGDPAKSKAGCDSCLTETSSQWYALGPAGFCLKVCSECWAYWKRYGDLKRSEQVEKLSLATAKYRFDCPVPNCTHASDSKHELRVHLETSHLGSNVSALLNSCSPTRVNSPSSGLTLTAKSNGSSKMALNASPPSDNFFQCYFDGFGTSNKDPPGACINLQMHAPFAWRICKRVQPDLNSYTRQVSRRPFKLAKMPEIFLQQESVDEQMRKLIRELGKQGVEELQKTISACYRKWMTPPLSGLCVTRIDRKLPGADGRLQCTLARIYKQVSSGGQLVEDDATRQLLTHDEDEEEASLVVAFPPDPQFVAGQKRVIEAVQQAKPPVPSEKKQDQEPARKRPCNGSKEGNNNGVAVPLSSPKKSLKTSTQLFLAPETLRKQRRNHVEFLHKLCRQPCTENQKERSEVVEKMVSEEPILKKSLL